MKPNLSTVITLLVAFFLFSTSCSTKFDEVPMERFEGKWELKGRPMFEGMVIEIKKNENGKLKGRIIELNQNKYVQFFSENGDVWLSSVTRNSSYQFEVEESKIGKELFGLYGLSSSSEFKAEFIDNDTIGISKSGDPAKSSIKYIRID